MICRLGRLGQRGTSVTATNDRGIYAMRGKHVVNNAGTYVL
jgi:hypothetical protein